MYDNDHPDTIRAKAEAKKVVLEARAQLHPVAQAVYAFWDSLGNFIDNIGCLILLIIVVVALFAPQLFDYLFGGK
jgi:hypothetical protein